VPAPTKHQDKQCLRARGSCGGRRNENGWLVLVLDVMVPDPLAGRAGVFVAFQSWLALGRCSQAREHRSNCCGYNLGWPTLRPMRLKISRARWPVRDFWLFDHQPDGALGLLVLLLLAVAPLYWIGVAAASITWWSRYPDANKAGPLTLLNLLILDCVVACLGCC